MGTVPLLPTVDGFHASAPSGVGRRAPACRNRPCRAVPAGSRLRFAGTGARRPGRRHALGHRLPHPGTHDLGVAVGIANGPALEVSKVDSRYVQGRTAAGGWSQHRFARRRENQARAAAADGADIAVRLLVPAAPGLAAVVTGGDRRAVDTILADARLASVAALRTERFLTVAEPRLAVLESAVRQARAVQIRLVEPDVTASA